jgi:hypothetical protein
MSMRGKTLSYLSWGACALALVACGAAGFVAWDVSSRLSSRQTLESSAQVEAAQQTSAVRIHALAADTQTQRGELQGLVQTDVVGIASAIQAAGNLAGASTKIGAASSEDRSASAPSDLNALDFVVEADGTFAQVFKAAQLFETLPLPSSVGELDFERVPEQSGGGPARGPWELTARIRVLTEAAISS